MDFALRNVAFEDTWTVIVALVLSTWFLASILHQFRFKWWRYVTRFDVSNLLPAWSFFAPNPGCHDLHLVYRDWFGESAGQWQQFYINSKLGWRWIWNPSRYPSKGLIDLIQSLFYNIKAFSDHPKSVLLSQSYISLLYFVMQQPQVKGTTHRQFAIVANQSFNKCSSLIVKYLSEKHRAEL